MDSHGKLKGFMGRVGNSHP